jgi:hypothetical protein
VLLSLLQEEGHTVLECFGPVAVTTAVFVSVLCCCMKGGGGGLMKLPHDQRGSLPGTPLLGACTH